MVGGNRLLGSRNEVLLGIAINDLVELFVEVIQLGFRESRQSQRA